MRSTPLVGADWIFAGLGDIWAVTTSNVSSLVQLSPSSLRVLHRFAYPGGGVPFDGRLWFIDNYSLKTFNATNGQVVVVKLPWLPTGLSPASVTSSGGELYLLAASKKTPATAIATYNPVSGAHRVVSEVDLGGGAGLLGVTDRVLWVEPPGGNMHTVAAYSAQSLRPLTGGFSDGFLNGTWTAVTDAGDLWFQIAGDPLDCVSGKTARVRYGVASAQHIQLAEHRRGDATGVRCSRHDQPHHRRERDTRSEPLRVRHRFLRDGPEM